MNKWDEVEKKGAEEHRPQASPDQSRRSLLEACPVRSWKFPDSHQAPSLLFTGGECMDVWGGVGLGDVCSFLFPKPAASYFWQPKAEIFKSTELKSSTDYSQV